MVLATFHMGPLPALGAFVGQLPGPVCVLVGGGEIVTRKAVYVRTLDGEAQRTGAFTEAVHTLRDRGYALVVVDGVGTGLIQETLLGRPISVSRGAFALSRLAQAPLLPVAVRWRGAAVEILAGDPIPPAGEAAMAAELVAWLERYLRRYPGELSYPLARLLGVPRGQRPR